MKLFPGRFLPNMVPPSSQLEAGQFRVRHLLWGTLAAAALLGSAGPWLRALPRHQVVRLGIAGFVLALCALIVIAHVWQRRKAQRAGGALRFRTVAGFRWSWLPAAPFLALLLPMGWHYFAVPPDEKLGIMLPVMTLLLTPMVCAPAYFYGSPIEVREHGYVWGTQLILWERVTRWWRKGEPPAAHCLNATGIQVLRLASRQQLREVESLLGRPPRQPPWGPRPMGQKNGSKDGR